MPKKKKGSPKKQRAQTATKQSNSAPIPSPPPPLSDPSAAAEKVPAAAEKQLQKTISRNAHIHTGAAVASLVLSLVALLNGVPLPSVLEKPQWADDMVTAGLMQADAPYTDVAKAGAVVLLWTALPGI